MTANPTSTALAAAFLLLGTTSCYALENADISRYLAESHFRLSQDPTPADATPLSVVAIQQNGFYFFGLLPVVSVSLEETIDELVKEGEKVGADGISNIAFTYLPPSILKFSAFPIPDWSATIAVTGMAYRRLNGPHATPHGSPSR